MKSILLIFFLLSTTSAFAADSVVTEKLFEQLGERVASLYEKELKAKDWSLSAEPDWKDMEGEALMQTRNAPYYSIIYSGSLVKKFKLSADALAVVLCHEAGHLFGKRLAGEDYPMSSAPEGEADYFATKDCLGKLWNKYPDLTPTSSLTANDYAALSKRISLDPKESHYQFILRAAAASIEVLRKMDKKPSLNFTDRDPSRVSNTLPHYPSTKCRLETYVAGFAGEARPKCWYK